MNDAHEGGYGRITIRKAFEKSSNVISKIINRAYSEEPMAFIERFKGTYSKTNQVNSRERMLEKLEIIESLKLKVLNKDLFSDI